MFTVFHRNCLSNKEILEKYDNEYFVEYLAYEDGKDICKIKPLTEEEYKEYKELKGVE